VYQDKMAAQAFPGGLPPAARQRFAWLLCGVVEDTEAKGDFSIDAIMDGITWHVNDRLDAKGRPACVESAHRSLVRRLKTELDEGGAELRRYVSSFLGMVKPGGFLL
jgi:hypothetical protein